MAAVGRVRRTALSQRWTAGVAVNRRQRGTARRVTVAAAQTLAPPGVASNCSHRHKSRSTSNECSSQSAASNIQHASSLLAYNHSNPVLYYSPLRAPPQTSAAPDPGPPPQHPACMPAAAALAAAACQPLVAAQGPAAAAAGPVRPPRRCRRLLHKQHVAANECKKASAASHATKPPTWPAKPTIQPDRSMPIQQQCFTLAPTRRQIDLLYLR